MNTAVRALPHHQFASRPQTQKILFKQLLQAIVLILAVLITAFAVVYVKDLYRRMFIQYQNLQNQQTQIYTDWGKLLLEQTTWSTQSRVQEIAAQRLGMEVPQSNDVVLVH
jgi:cell division protein FtsL